MRFFRASILTVALCALPAGAAVPSVLAGNTLGTGKDVLHFQAGWPGISATLLHGLNERADVGGRFSFNYGYEGLTTVVPGLKLQGIVRIELVDKPRYNLGLRFEPGLFVYFDNNRFGDDIAAGMTIPAALALGIPVKPDIMFNFGFEIPFFFVFNYSQFVVPILFGAGLEYQLDNNLSLTFNTRFGPAIIATNGGSDARFAFQTLIGLAFKL